jgi:hypothetical protein
MTKIQITLWASVDVFVLQSFYDNHSMNALLMYSTHNGNTSLQVMVTMVARNNTLLMVLIINNYCYLLLGKLFDEGPL